MRCSGCREDWTTGLPHGRARWTPHRLHGVSPHSHCGHFCSARWHFDDVACSCNDSAFSRGEQCLLTTSHCVANNERNFSPFPSCMHSQLLGVDFIGVSKGRISPLPSGTQLLRHAVSFISNGNAHSLIARSEPHPQPHRTLIVVPRRALLQQPTTSQTPICPPSGVQSAAKPSRFVPSTA